MKKSIRSKKNQHTISLLVANKPGVLVRIALVFARRGFNIDSLTVSPSFDERFSRMTITAQGDPSTLEQIIKQAGKLIDVLNAEEHAPEKGIEKELALFKIRYKAQSKITLLKILKKFHAHIIEKTDVSVIIEQTGTSDEIDGLEIELKPFGLIELVRTGKILIARGNEPT
ncbi:MAG TPA: acetolactate synthase small subunit [Candidatus Omnitrophota bacterium]|nr:acetolactate synthase small subunit [Candidatus Omnitrophota bacterium]HQL42171.1 acetolactate synthase small subunit [Candidatus Omnitrophota bacterium]